MIFKKASSIVALFKNNLVVLFGVGFVSFLNYLFHLITAQLLAPSQYGLLQSFIALTYFSGVLNGALSFSIIRQTASIPKSLIWPTVNKLENKFAKISFLFFLGFLSLTPFIKEFLHLEKTGHLFIFALYLVFFLLPTIYLSIFQARLKFLEFSFLSILGALAKIILASFLILGGFQVGGGLIGIAASAILVILAGRFLVASCWQKKSKVTGKENLITGFWQYSFLSLLTNLFLVSPFSSDILLVRHFFPASQAGIYAATSTLGKIIFFSSSAILIVAFPSFVKSKNNQEKLRQTFSLSFLFLITISFLGFMAFKFLPKAVVGLLYNQNYSATAAFLPAFAIFISLLAIFNLFIRFLLALESHMALWLSALVALSQILLIILHHNTLEIIIENSIISLVLGLFFCLFSVKKFLYAQKS